MTIKQRVEAQSGVVLRVEKNILDDAVEIAIRLEDDSECVLHWGLSKRHRGSWQVPPRTLWPEGSRVVEGAIQTPFLIQNGARQVVINLDRGSEFSFINFVLYFPEDNRWDNHSGQNYQIEIPKDQAEQPALSPMDRLQREIGKGKLCYAQTYLIQNESELAVTVSHDERGYRVALLTNLPSPTVLHWGVAKHTRYEWQPPPATLYPDGTSASGDNAAQTPFKNFEGYRRIDFTVNESDAPLGIPFVLNLPESGQWLKDRGHNFYVPLSAPPEREASLGNEGLAGIADEIIQQEMSKNSWTLMHRFNLCYDLLDRAKNNIDAKALIFVWLRYSYLRQLDWQRNYNTKPRELGHSMDRLTLKLGDLYREERGDREAIRLIMTTLGRGSDAQRVRDEVLHIMHRHHIKEVSGHFMEEWHQKLHNNTTADDIVICEAFLEFLRSNGNLDRFYQKLGEEGVTRERLESYERPIKSHPDFIPHLKDALIHDFEHFLGILKEVHSGTDLGTAIHNARYLYDEEMHRLMDSIWRHRNDSDVPATALADKISEARRWVQGRLTVGSGSEIRDLLFLDLALEDFLRALIERSLDSHMKGDQMGELMGRVIENLTFSRQDETIGRSLQQWNRIMQQKTSRPEWALQAKAALDHLAQILGSFIDRYHQLLQPKAELLGRAFHAAQWTITMFTEEVVRGRLEFALSMLLRYFDPILRKEAHLGNWQVISRGGGTGQVVTSADLKSVQGNDFDEPTVLVTDAVVGNEEIPAGVIAVLTPDTTDIVSHVAIRARNARLLFATCYDADTIQQLKSLAGQWVKVSVDATGQVMFEEARETEEKRESRRVRSQQISLSPREFTTYAVSSKDFSDRNVGGKANNITRLQGKLPDWVALPISVAVPFGVFEEVLGVPNNQDVASQHEELVQRLGKTEKKEKREKILDELRKTILELNAPDNLIVSLRDVMKEAGLPWPEEWEAAWTCIKQVWGSKWNERAYLSRKAMGIAHQDLYMAVLIQEVVEAEYSFVIHTVNPFTGNKSEIYAEVVLGLGEALVANFPGRALSFTCKKGARDPHILSFPSKSQGVFGGGLIFRSDSNGEDLVDYAGAGLYDSFMLPHPNKIFVDYSNESLVWDENFRKDLLFSIASIGTEVEKATQSAQDIEGAYCKGKYYVVQTRPQVGI